MKVRPSRSEGTELTGEQAYTDHDPTIYAIAASIIF